MMKKEGNRPFLIFLAILSGVIASANIGKISAALPFVLSDFGISIIDGGFLLSVFSLSAVLLCFLVGQFVNEKNVLLLIALGLFLLSAGGAWGSHITQYNSFLLSRLIEGVGFVLVVVSSPYLISLSTDSKSRKGSMLLWGIALPLGISLGIFLFSPFEGDESWRIYWLIIAPFCLLLSMLFVMLYFLAPLASWQDNVKVKSKPKFLNIFRNKFLFLLAAAFFLYNLQNLAVISWLGKLVSDYIKLEGVSFSTLSAFVIFFNVIGNVVIFLFGKKVLLPVLLISAQLFMTLAICLFFFVDGVWMKISCLLLFSFFGGMLPGTLMSYVPRYAKKESDIPAGVSLLVFGDNLGALAGPTLFAISVYFVNDWWGFSFVSIISLALMILISLVFTRA